MHEHEVSDERLIQALADGAIWPLERLYHRYSRLLYAVAYRILNDHQTAEEVVQDVFVALWQHASSYMSQASTVRGWLIALTHHRAIDYQRGMRRRTCVQEIALETAEEEDAATLPDVWEDVWGSVQRAQVREALLQVPSEQRLVILLAYFWGWTHTQIAQRCHLPFGTVKSRLRLGLLHLKQALEQQEGGTLSRSNKRNREEVRPRQTAPVVVQTTMSGCESGYELYHDGSYRCFGYTEWEHLLEQIEAFEFRGRAGNLTARKEKRLHSRVYWYAVRWGGTHRHKVYLGRPAELTLARLEARASLLHEGERDD